MVLAGLDSKPREGGRKTHGHDAAFDLHRRVGCRLLALLPSDGLHGPCREILLVIHAMIGWSFFAGEPGRLISRNMDRNTWESIVLESYVLYERVDKS